LTVWGLGIARRGYLYGAHLEKIEPELKQMVANGGFAPIPSKSALGIKTLSLL